MIYPYNVEFDPPAPMIDVSVAGVVHSRPQVTLPALIDTGSDFTAVPHSLIDQLNLYPIGRVAFENVDAQTKIVPIYGIQLHIASQNLSISGLEVLITGFDFVVLGRDVLQELEVFLNGPAQQIEIKNPMNKS